MGGAVLGSRVAECHMTQGHGPAMWHQGQSSALCLPSGGRAPSVPILSSPLKGGENPRLDQKQAREEAACGDGIRDTPALKSENGRTRKRLFGFHWHNFLH